MVPCNPFRPLARLLDPFVCHCRLIVLLMGHLVKCFGYFLFSYSCWNGFYPLLVLTLQSKMSSKLMTVLVLLWKKKSKDTFLSVVTH